MFLLDLHSAANWELLWFAVDTILNTPTWDKLLGSGLDVYAKEPGANGTEFEDAAGGTQPGPQQDPAGAYKAHPLGSFRPAGKNSPVYIWVYLCIIVSYCFILFHIVSYCFILFLSGPQATGRYLMGSLSSQTTVGGQRVPDLFSSTAVGIALQNWVFQDIGTCTLLCALLFNLNMFYMQFDKPPCPFNLS